MNPFVQLSSKRKLFTLLSWLLILTNLPSAFPSNFSPIQSAHAEDRLDFQAKNQPSIALASIGQNFNTANTGLPYAAANHVPVGVGSQLIAGGPTGQGQFIRLAFADAIPSHNSIAFDIAEAGLFEQTVVDFDFRMSPGNGRADGFGVAFLNKETYGEIGPIEPQAPLYAAEEPNFVNSIGIGFDIHQATGGRAEINNNHLSVHFGSLLQEANAFPAFDLASGEWSHARIIMQPGDAQPMVTVELSQCGQTAVKVIDQLAVPGFTPYAGRLYFVARSGGESADHDIDNVVVQSLAQSETPQTIGANCLLETTGTHQDFEQPGLGTLYALGTHLPDPSPSPEQLAGGPTDMGTMLRLAYGGTEKTHNSIAFDQSDTGLSDLVIADFDFRITPGTGRADGFGFALLNTTTYGASGVVSPLAVAEEPNFIESLGIGFDIYQSDADHLEINNNHISIHHGELLEEIDLRPVLDIAEGEWIHAQIVMRSGADTPTVSISLSQCGRSPVVVVDQFPIPGLSPYESRAYFGARSGGLTADQDIDNVHVRFMNAEPALVGFKTGCHAVDERDSEVSLQLSRTGHTNEAVAVNYATVGHTATSGTDYTSTAGTIIFNAGETIKTIRVPITDDNLDGEKGESFLIILSEPQGNAILSGPTSAKMSIIDDETARQEGDWGALIPSQVVPIQMQLLPTGQVMYWDRDDGLKGWDGNPRLFNPMTEQISEAATVEYDLFCSGHSFLADGRMLVTGGHVEDAVGEDKASIYNPFDDSWERLPDMNAGRWYPSQVALADGGTLVLAGTFEQSERIVLNSLPQVWPADGSGWRNLTAAKYGDFADDPEIYPPNYYPDHADYYPFIYAAPDGRVFDAGPQSMSRALDTRGKGAWSPIAPSRLAYRDYGTSVMFDDGKVMITGGNPRDPQLNTNPTIAPSTRTEVIDLNATDPTWQEAAPMHMGRRHLNSTLLPDGQVLITGGSSVPGFDVEAGAVLEAEMWNSALDEWTLLAPQTRYRGYHSTALLLPDGRVITGGGGHPNPQSGAQYNFEIFSPPYLFKGTRPKILEVPASVYYGEKFPVTTDEAQSISNVNWIRLSAVTHAFNQSQRINRLAFESAVGRVTITAPGDPNLAQPGHYMLFILNEDGVPSIAKIIQLKPKEVIEPPTNTVTHTPTPTPTQTPTLTDMPTATPTSTATPTATPTVAVSKAHITIIADAKPGSRRNFRFDGTLGTFRLDDPAIDDEDSIRNSLTFEVTPGEHTVSEQVPGRWFLTDIICTSGHSLVDLEENNVSLTVNAGDTITCTFYNERASTIRTRVYHDLDGNGQRNREPLLDSWKASLYDKDGVLLRNYMTNQYGKANFNRLRPGDYTVCMALQEGWHNTEPGMIDPGFDSQPCYTFIIEAREIVILFFGNQAGSTAATYNNPMPSTTIIRLVDPFEDSDDDDYEKLPEDTDIDKPIQDEPISLDERIYLPSIHR